MAIVTWRVWTWFCLITFLPSSCGWTSKYNCMNLYRARECLSDFKNVFKRGVKWPKTIRSLEDSLRQKQTKTIKKKIEEFIREHCRPSIRAVGDLTENDKESVRQILHESFNMHNFCAKTVQQYVAPEQKERERTSVPTFQTALSENRVY